VGSYECGDENFGSGATDIYIYIYIYIYMKNLCTTKHLHSIQVFLLVVTEVLILVFN
jgi:hypothetical protein